jgi:ornithine decarboxylase
MSQVEVLRIQPIDFCNNHFLRLINNPPDATPNLEPDAPYFVGSVSVPAQTDSRDGLITPFNTIELFDDLPPLHTGSVTTHIQRGIENAALASAANEPDAERAFFVADLSQVYDQFIRWKKCLPDIVPYYGEKTVQAQQIRNSN